MLKKNLVAKRGEEPRFIARLGERSPLDMRYGRPGQIKVIRDPRMVPPPPWPRFRKTRAFLFALAGLVAAGLVAGLFELLKLGAGSR